MKLIKKASGKIIIKLSQMDWERIGQKGGWLKKSEKATREFLDEITKSGPQSINNFNEQFEQRTRRNDHVSNYGWALPNEDAINQIKSFVGADKIIEIGSGLGAWAKLLQSEGISITPTDISIDPNVNRQIGRSKGHTNIEVIDGVNAIKKYGDHSVLMMVWPPYDNPIAFNVLNSFKGNKVIFVGEGYGGCTADDNFFNLLEEEWSLYSYISIPSWPMINDGLFLYIRN